MTMNADIPHGRSLVHVGGHYVERWQRRTYSIHLGTITPARQKPSQASVTLASDSEGWPDWDGELGMLVPVAPPRCFPCGCPR